MESYWIMLVSSGSRSNNDFPCSTRFFVSEFFSTNYPIGFDFIFNFFDVFFYKTTNLLSHPSFRIFSLVALYKSPIVRHPPPCSIYFDYGSCGSPID